MRCSHKSTPQLLYARGPWMGHLHTVVPQTCTLMGSSEPTSLTSFFGFHHAAPCGHTEHATLSHGTCCVAHTHEILSVHTTHYVVHMQHATLFTQNILRFSRETFMAEGALHTHCATSAAPTGHSAQGPHCDTNAQNDPARLLSGCMAACLLALSSRLPNMKGHPVPRAAAMR